MDISNGKEEPKMQEYDAGRKEVKEEGAGRRKWKLKNRQCVNSGSGPDYQIYIPLRWAPW
jgi:hypothetical protein